MSTRTRRRDVGATKTRAQRRKERWQAKFAAAGTPAARFAVRQDGFRASVEFMVHRHTVTDRAGFKHTDPRAEAQADQLLEFAGDWLGQLMAAVDGGDYDQPGQ